jgi:hypothetical protein
MPRPDPQPQGRFDSGRTQIMSTTRSYDPIAALGIRLGTELGLPFLIEHEQILGQGYGVSFVECLRKVLLAGDEKAAMLVVRCLTPTATYRVTRRRDWIDVHYKDGAIDGRSSRKIEDSKAVALVTAAMHVYEANNRFAKGALPSAHQRLDFKRQADALASATERSS